MWVMSIPRCDQLVHDVDWGEIRYRMWVRNVIHTQIIGWLGSSVQLIFCSLSSIHYVISVHYVYLGNL